MNQRGKLAISKPYYLVLHPLSGKVAVYNRQYKKIAEDASVELVGQAVKHNTQITPGLGLTHPEQHPSWINDEIRDQCVGYHLYADRFPVSEIEKIPDK